MDWLSQQLQHVLPHVSHQALNVLQLYPAAAGAKVDFTVTPDAEVRPSEVAARQLLSSCLTKLLLLEELVAGRHVDPAKMVARPVGPDGSLRTSGSKEATGKLPDLGLPLRLTLADL